ncbi:hypothetical protein IW261DRAFT_482165 [Armillaria novae-zelandiae]|uniref:Uncharacterized protein n=1 Tax=Armillaria novae-zelandiae TaxID=153914 RepID=A0AA39P0X7_9AGAR|nr:hypothetical protein IW261DRAFT_482165 [Armillaria novae-zelandiae]
MDRIRWVRTRDERRGDLPRRDVVPQAGCGSRDVLFISVDQNDASIPSPGRVVVLASCSNSLGRLVFDRSRIHTQPTHAYIPTSYEAISSTTKMKGVPPNFQVSQHVQIPPPSPPAVQRSSNRGVARRPEDEVCTSMSSKYWRRGPLSRLTLERETGVRLSQRLGCTPSQIAFFLHICVLTTPTSCRMPTTPPAYLKSRLRVGGLVPCRKLDEIRGSLVSNGL